ncbi:hypothetical protein [Clostridium estertheticum]|uniref:Uncharacterized protein n=1 Tax=Clostridium estertheticum TaxID=238834 RepID=A0AA47ELM2_9CLOT|nr:hypothetical protein [Clostridium estertheticum]MBU3157359.1 hypothetical protein [Clostridium estertheticum]WAG62462.1 hypothetical protein LL038_09590 [Clostridium estertheticum]
MFNKMKQYIKKNIILSIGIVLCLGIMSTYSYTKIMPGWFSQPDTYNLVKEAFLTNKGYTNELPKHMSQQVFERTNIYNAYPVKVMDLQNNLLGGSSNIPITFTIENIKGEWYITEKEESV